MPPMNSFSFGAQIGGPDYSEAARRQEQQLRDAFNRWSGSYSPDVREFAFLLRIDGKIHPYTEMWQIRGAQKARRKQDWIEVEIGVPEKWWREADSDGYKKRLAEEVEAGLRSMIDVLLSKKHRIDGQALLSDWNQIKTSYLASSLWLT
jgi:hypothetical protein